MFEAPESGITQHVWCSVAISKKMEDVFIGFILSQAQEDQPQVSEYVIYLSTLGGSVYSAINLYNFMKTIPQKTTVYNMGSVFSAGITFFLSFENRIAVPDSNFLIHQTTIPRTLLPEQFNMFDLDAQKKYLEKIDTDTNKIIVNETKNAASKPFTLASLNQIAQDSTTFNTKEALERGLIDKVEIPKLPETGVLYITDQYLSTLPGELN